MRISLTLFIALISISLFAQTKGADLKQQKDTVPVLDTLRVAYYVSPPFVEQKNGKLGGISFWLWQTIAKEIKQPYVLEEMSLSDVITGLSKGDVDLTINPLTITSERGTVIDFSAPYFISKSGLLVKSVSKLQKWSSFALSFFSINFLRAILALFFVVFVFGAFVWLFERKANSSEFKPGIKGLWSGIWWSAVTMTTVGYGDKSPKSVGGRIVGLIWMFAAIIMISGFTASIASSLTVNQLGWDKSKIDDYKETRIATVERSATQHFLKRHFFQNIVSYTSLNECIEALHEDKVVAVAYDYPQIMSVALQDTTQKLEMSSVHYNSQLYAFGFAESLPEPVQEIITNELLKITESYDYKIVLAEYSLIED